MMPSLFKFIKAQLSTMLWLTIAGFVMSWFIWRGCCTTISALTWITVFTATIWIALWLGNSYLAESLNYFYSWHKEPVKRLIIGLVGMTAYTIGAVKGIIFLFQYVSGFDVGDDLSTTLTSTIGITLIITMFMTGREFLMNWRQAAVDAEVSKRASINAQYESLKNQVNPHFLFNSLNALTNLVYEDQDKAAKFIKQLSEVYRYVLDTRDKEVVALEEEMKFLNSYLFLQQIRFGENLLVKINLSTHGKLIAPLALQLLVENAIKHNEASSENALSIVITEEDGYILVENSLQRKVMPDEKSPGIGLENIKSRYTFLSSQPVVVEERDNKFVVKLPLIQSEEL
jgi:sensor histidine kinase YesM